MSNCSHAQAYFSMMCKALSEANLKPVSKSGSKGVEQSKAMLETAILTFLTHTKIAPADQGDYLTPVFNTGSHAVLSMALARFDPTVRDVASDLTTTRTLCKRADLQFLRCAIHARIQTWGLFEELCKRVIKLGEPTLRASVMEHLETLDRTTNLSWIFECKPEQLKHQPEFLTEMTLAQFARMEPKGGHMLKTALVRRRGALAIFFKLCGADLKGRTDISKDMLELWTGMTNHQMAKILGSSGTPAAFLADLDAMARADEFFSQ